MLSNVYDFITDKSISIPLGEMIVFVLLVSIFMLYRMYRLGLITAFCFVFYWGFVINFGNFAAMLADSSAGMAVYVLFGLFLVILVIIGSFQEDGA